jgi:outer membrane protein OmpA-like peptidoglycan-associated protein
MRDVQGAGSVFSNLRGTAVRGLACRCRPIAGVSAATACLAGTIMLGGCAPAAADTPKNIIIVASATANEPAPVLSTQDRALLRAAGSGSTHAQAFVVNPDTGQAREVSLTPRRADGEVDYGPDRDSRLAANVRQVQQVLNTLAASKPFDLLAMITQGIRVSSRPGTLLVLSSGVSTAGGFNLAKVGWGASPHTAAVTLRRRGLLPSLAGWHVVFAGLADTAGRQPALPLPQRTVLTRYWLALCRTARAATCAVDTVTRPEPSSRSTTPVPVVRVPQVKSVTGPRGQIIDVPADAFFAFNSARLLPGADVILRPAAARARSQHLKVSIVGYSSPDGGTAAYNLRLSARRARAVKMRLIALKVPAGLIVEAAGRGTAGRVRSACVRNGHLDESICARLRRVMITLHSARAGAS